MAEAAPPVTMQTIGRFEIGEVIGSAMAKLRHPSLMPVFDVGSCEGGVYIAMPRVTGGTLHDWLNAEPRPCRAVLDRFLAAGRGLAAAHGAGLMHGDFDSGDVILGRGGEVLVTRPSVLAQHPAP